MESPFISFNFPKISEGEQKISKGEHKISKGEHKISKGEQKISKGEQKISKGEQKISKCEKKILFRNYQICHCGTTSHTEQRRTRNNSNTKLIGLFILLFDTTGIFCKHFLLHEY